MKFSPLKLIPFVSIPALLISFQNCSKVGTNGISVDQIQSGQSADLVPQVSDIAMDPGVTTPPKNQDPANTNTTSTNTTNTSTSNTSTSNTSTTTNNTNTSTQSDDKKCTNCQASNQHHHHDYEDDDKDCHEDRDKNPSGDKKHSEDEHKEDDDDDHKQSSTDLVITDAIKACNDPKLLSQPSDNLILQFNHENIELDANSVSSIQGNWGRYVIIRAAAKENAKVGSVHVNHTTLILCNFAEIKEIKGTHNRIIVVDGKIQEIHANNSNISLVNASVEKSKGSNSVVKSYTKE